MNCKVVEDLLPLYTEKMCAEETAREIKQHLCECKACSEKAASFSVAVEEELAKNNEELELSQQVPEKAFRRVRRKMKRDRVCILMLFVLILCILGAVTYLGYGQITKQEGSVSFDTIAEEIRVR